MTNTPKIPFEFPVDSGQMWDANNDHEIDFEDSKGIDQDIARVFISTIQTGYKYDPPFTDYYHQFFEAKHDAIQAFYSRPLSMDSALTCEGFEFDEKKVYNLYNLNMYSKPMINCKLDRSAKHLTFDSIVGNSRFLECRSQYGFVPLNNGFPDIDAIKEAHAQGVKFYTGCGREGACECEPHADVGEACSTYGEHEQ